jgi:hypothetical protein
MVHPNQRLDGAVPEHLQGSVERVTFHSPESGFCVLRVKVRGHRELVTVIGSAASITPGEYVECAGAWTNDRQHGSEEIEFAPGPVRFGDYFFDIGTAGATSLVLQTLLLPLALAPGTSSVTIRGGTHVPWSPCFHYLYWQWRPFLARIGVPFDLTMTMAGFYPRGGGELQAQIPGETRPTPLRLTERGPLRTVRGLSAVANLPREIAERQRRQALRRLRNLLPEVEPQVVVEELPAASRGTVLLLLAECAAVHAASPSAPSAPAVSARSASPTRRWTHWRPFCAATAPSIPGWQTSCCCRWRWLTGNPSCAPARSLYTCSQMRR